MQRLRRGGGSGAPACSSTFFGWAAQRCERLRGGGDGGTICASLPSDATSLVAFGMRDLTPMVSGTEDPIPAMLATIAFALTLLLAVVVSWLVASGSA